MRPSSPCTAGACTHCHGWGGGCCPFTGGCGHLYVSVNTHCVVCAWAVVVVHVQVWALIIVGACFQVL